MINRFRILMVFIMVFPVSAAVWASSSDQFLINSDNYRFQVQWGFAIENAEVYNITLYWPLFDLFSRNWETMKNMQDRDSFEVRFRDKAFVLYLDYPESFVEIFKHRDFRKIIEFLCSFLTDKYSLSYTPRSCGRIYKISLPFVQDGDYPSYSGAALYSEFAFGAAMSFHNQYEKGFNLIYFDHDRLLKTESLIQRYNYSVYSQIITADTLEEYLFSGPDGDNSGKRAEHGFITCEQALKLETGMTKEEVFRFLEIPYDTVMGFYEQDIYQYYGFGEFSAHALRLHFLDDKLVQVGVDVFGPITVIESYESLADWKRDYP